MKHKSTLFYILALIGVVATASMLTGMSSAGAVPNPPAARALQDTAAPTLAPTLPPIQVTPQITVVPGTVVVPSTGGGQPMGGSWLFLAILIVAGLAFLVAIVALMRRPYP